MPQSYMRQLRAEAARGFGPIGGRSVTARLIVESADVEQAFVEKAIRFWIEGVWDGAIEEEVLQRAWRQACVELAAEFHR